jgi:PII interaction protein X
MNWNISTSKPALTTIYSFASAKRQSDMTNETYLNHPTFGMLYRICGIDDGQELFATLYAQRLFFKVRSSKAGFQFEPVGRADARMLVENQLRVLRRSGTPADFAQLQKIHKQTFQ